VWGESTAVQTRKTWLKLAERKGEIVVASEMEKGDGDLSGKPQFF
jgi:hypothetical protein